MLNEFDEIGFEKKIYRLVTAEINELFSTLIKADDQERLQGDGVRIQLAVTKGLHRVVQETVMQISYGLNIHHRLHDMKRAQTSTSAQQEALPEEVD